MTHNLFPFEIGDEVVIELVNLKKGGLVKIQPHDSIFITLDDHKKVLEDALTKYSTLTSGTSIIIQSQEMEFNLGIVELKGGGEGGGGKGLG